jgi:hypothetical protein
MYKTFIAIIGVSSLTACSGGESSSGPRMQDSVLVDGVGQAGRGSGPAAPSTPANASASTSGGASTQGSDPALAKSPPSEAACAANLPVKVPGCACERGQTFSCWTGAPDKRHVGACHDGTQECVANAEFAAWGPCGGEGHDCGDTPDAGQPDAGQQDAGQRDAGEDCSCVPGAMIQCDEDCSVSIFCNLTATKTCQPDGTWGPCHESPGGGIPDVANVLGDAGVGGLLNGTVGGCRTMFFGCDALGLKETFTGDCSQQFMCGHPPQL